MLYLAKANLYFDLNLGNARHPDALWEEGKLLEAMFFWEILEHNNS